MQSDQLRILVVDDEPDLCWAIDLLLRPLGAKVVTTTNSVDALRHITREPFSLVLIDAILPGIPGLSLARMVGQLNPAAAVVLMSGYYEPEHPDVGAVRGQLPLAGFLAKPFRLSDVRRIVQTVLATKEGFHGLHPCC